VESKQSEPSATSSIVDFSTTAKGSALPVLQRNFGVSARNVKSEPQASQVGARYRIVAGDDFNPCYFSSGTGTVRAQPQQTSTPVAGVQPPAPQPVEPTPQPAAPAPPAQAPAEQPPAAPAPVPTAAP
jgi:hypothetical protein